MVANHLGVCERGGVAGHDNGGHATATSWLFMTAMRDVKAKAMRHGAEEKEKIM